MEGGVGSLILSILTTDGVRTSIGMLKEKERERERERAKERGKRMIFSFEEASRTGVCRRLSIKCVKSQRRPMAASMAFVDQLHAGKLSVIELTPLIGSWRPTAGALPVCFQASGITAAVTPTNSTPFTRRIIINK